MSAPLPDPTAVDSTLIERLRSAVRATDATKYPDADLAEYLQRAKMDVDRRIGATRGLEVTLVRGWYLAVAAELFDRDHTPASHVPERFGGDNAARAPRATRNPLAVIEREVRQWVPTW